MENVNKAIDDLVSYITHTKEYERCISLKKQMSENEEITTLINKIKRLQKEYIRSNYDSKIKEELDLLEERINSIPVYHMYNDSLEKVNEMITFVKDSMNDYFYELLNKKN